MRAEGCRLVNVAEFVGGVYYGPVSVSECTEVEMEASLNEANMLAPVWANIQYGQRVSRANHTLRLQHAKPCVCPLAAG